MTGTPVFFIFSELIRRPFLNGAEYVNFRGFFIVFSTALCIYILVCIGRAVNFLEAGVAGSHE